MGDMEKALVQFDESLEIESNNVNTIIKRASLLFELKKIEESIVEYKKAVSLEPDNADIYYHRGQVITFLFSFYLFFFFFSIFFF